MSYGNEFSFEGVARTMKEEVKILDRGNSFSLALLNAIRKELRVPPRTLTLGGAQYRICSHIWDVHFPEKPRPFPCPDKTLEAMPMKGYILVAASNKAFEDVDLAIDVIKRNQLPDPPKEDEPKPSFGVQAIVPKGKAAAKIADTGKGKKVIVEKDDKKEKGKQEVRETVEDDANTVIKKRDEKKDEKKDEMKDEMKKKEQQATAPVQQLAANSTDSDKKIEQTRKKVVNLPLQEPDIFDWADEEMPALPPTSVHARMTNQPPTVTSAPGIGGVLRQAAATTPATTPPKPQKCRFREWKNKDNKDLPCFTGVGPGDIILPDNMDPYKHILPVKDKLEQWLNVRIHVEAKSVRQKHNVIQLWPLSATQDRQLTILNGTMAFYILESWAFRVADLEKLMSVFGIVRNFKLMRGPWLDKRIEDLSAIQGRAMFPKAPK
ncbi:hypothetical protein ABKA04_002227 [Annulohypoxylon sp. FPYF3050]